MRRVLLLMTGSTYKAGAFLEAAQRRGIEVTVGGDRPQALAGLNPAGHLTLDFADPEGATRAVLEHAARHPLHAVVAADDDGALLAAAAGAGLGLPHHPLEAVRAARDKLLTRTRLAAARLPAPWFEAIAPGADPEPLAARLRYPCVLKPRALAASRGVMRADDPTGFVAAYRRLERLLARGDAEVAGPRSAWCPPRDGDMLVEGYIPGAEVALEGLLTRGALRTLALFDKPDPLEGPFFEETLYVQPSRLGSATRHAVVAAVASGVKALGLLHGPIHAELRLAPGGPFVLEIAARSIGGLCSRALRFGGGASLEELILEHALGADLAGLDPDAGASGVMMIPIPSAGRLVEVRGTAEARAIPGIEELRLTVLPGQAVEPPPEGGRYLGFLFARGPTPGEVEAALREAHRRLVIDIESVVIAGTAGKEST